MQLLDSDKKNIATPDRCCDIIYYATNPYLRFAGFVGTYFKKSFTISSRCSGVA